MSKEIISTGKTVEAALAQAARQLGKPAEELEYELIAAPKRGFLGIGEVPAKIRVIIPEEKKKSGAETALDFIENLLNNMGVEADIQLIDQKNGDKLIKIYGERASVLIGHHGDTLDSLQYLVNLAANKKDGDGDESEYTRITVDIEDYRARREATLRALARRMASKVRKYGRQCALEPMSAAERRIIHSEIQSIEGVTTKSVGQEGNRRVVILPERDDVQPETQTENSEE